MIPMNVAAVMPAPSASAARTRYLSRDELKAVWTAAGELGEFGRVVRFLFAMPVRVSIAANLDLADVSHNARTLRLDEEARGNKSRIEWILPLPEIAMAYIGDGQPVAIRSEHKDKLDGLSGVTDWWLHDVRRTVQTLLGDAVRDLDADAADRWLQHKPVGIASVYQRSQRSAAMRIVAGHWDAVLRDIVEPGSAKLVALPARA